MGFASLPQPVLRRPVEFWHGPARAYCPAFSIQRQSILGEEGHPMDLGDYQDPLTSLTFLCEQVLNGVDPLDPKVESWWKQKVEDLVKHVPSFGGEF